MLPATDHEMTLIIPAFNEERRLPKTLDAVRRFLDAARLDYRVVVADDGSTDRTVSLTRRYGWRFSTLSSPHRGKGYAVRGAMLAATGEVLAFTDADSPFDLQSLIDGYQSIAVHRCEVAYGTRYAEHSENLVARQLVRSIASHTFHFLVRCCVSRDVRDCQCGLKVFSRRAAVEIFSRAQVDGFAFDTEVVMLAERLGLKRCCIPVTLVSEETSTVSVWRHSLPMALDVVRARYRLGRRRITATHEVGWGELPTNRRIAA